MASMPNVHIRDLPPETVETLRAAARRHGRSLNAEIVAALVERAQREERTARAQEKLDRIAAAWRARNPDGYPPGLEPETIIREARDSR
jgi:plasmid stability protein